MHTVKILCSLEEFLLTFFLVECHPFGEADKQELSERDLGKLSTCMTQKTQVSKWQVLRAMSPAKDVGCHVVFEQKLRSNISNSSKILVRDPFICLSLCEIQAGRAQGFVYLHPTTLFNITLQEPPHGPHIITNHKLVNGGPTRYMVG